MFFFLQLSSSCHQIEKCIKESDMVLNLQEDNYLKNVMQLIDETVFIFATHEFLDAM